MRIAEGFRSNAHLIKKEPLDSVQGLFLYICPKSLALYLNFYLPFLNLFLISG